MAADGPRHDRPAEQMLCQQARQVVMDAIDWPCELHTNFRAQNLGCKRAVSSAITWFFDHVEAGIILEDDTIPNQSFFRYCEEMLEIYKDDERVGVISGNNFQAESYTPNQSYYFSLYTYIWGWASWRRAWRKYDLEMKDWPQLRDQGWLLDLHQNIETARYWAVQFERMYQGLIDTWDYAWTYSCWRSGMLSALPSRNLVTNIGFRADATHTTLENRLANLATAEMQFPLKHPKLILRDVNSDRRSEVNVFEVPGMYLEQNEQNMDTTQHLSAAAQIDQALDILGTGDANRALSILNSINATERDLHHVRAMCLFELGCSSDAKRELLTEIKFFPDNQHAKDLLNMLDSETGATTSSGGLQQVKSSQPNLSLVELINRANEALEQNRYVECLAMLDQISDIDDSIRGLYNLRAIALERFGKLELALESACEELRRDPTNDSARHTCGVIATKITCLKKPRPNPEQRTFKSNLDSTATSSIANECERSLYHGYRFSKNPFDLSLYLKLLEQFKPRTIVHFGQNAFGDALWFGDQLNALQLQGEVIWIGDQMAQGISHPRVKFLCSKHSALNQLLALESYPKPLMVVINNECDEGSSAKLMAQTHPALEGGEYLIIEGAQQSVLASFFAQFPGEYDVDSEYTDCYGYNFTSAVNGFLRKKRYALNPLVPKEEIRAFNIDDPAPQGIESQMSINERFQLFTAIARHLPKRDANLKFVEIGSHAGASLLLATRALKRSGRPLQGYAVEPQGTRQFYEVLNQLGPDVTHLKMFSHPAAQQLSEIFSRDQQLADFILIDGDHTLDGVRQDVLDYYPLLAPGGIMVFHDYLPAINDTNRAAIHFHHAGWEPGIRQACQELMETKYRCEVLDLPLLYPEDPSQTQPHLPMIPGVFSTLRAYRKPL